MTDDTARKAVPREPTETMLDAAAACDLESRAAGYPNEHEALWKAMYDVAPVLATAPAEPPHAEDRIERAVLIKQLRDAADALEYADGYIEGALEVIDAYAEEKAATPSRLASGPSQEGADGSAAAPPTAPAEPPKDGEALTWRQGITLSTRQTRQWTEQQRKDNDAIERCMVFARFSDADEGRSRIHIGTCKSAEDAERIVTAHNNALEKRLSAPPSGEVAALIEQLETIQPGFDGCVTGHALAQKAAAMLRRLPAHGGQTAPECYRYMERKARDLEEKLAAAAAPVPELTERERGVLRHALTGGRNTAPYRNHFAADEGHADMPTLRALVARGLMTERKNKSPITPDTLFHCTEAGAKAVGLHLPNDSPVAAPVPALTDEQIVAIRDEHLPSQGEPFDCIAFARAILAVPAREDDRLDEFQQYLCAECPNKSKWRRRFNEYLMTQMHREVVNCNNARTEGFKQGYESAPKNNELDARRYRFIKAYCEVTHDGQAIADNGELDALMQKFAISPLRDARGTG